MWGTPRVGCVAGRKIDARTQTEAAPDGQTDLRYPTRVSELANRRLRLRLPFCTIHLNNAVAARGKP